MKELVYKNFLVVEQHPIKAKNLRVAHPYFKLNEGRDFHINYCAIYCNNGTNNERTFIAVSFPAAKTIYLYCRRGQTNLCLVTGE